MIDLCFPQSQETFAEHCRRTLRGAGSIVKKPQDYVYSSASNYIDKIGIVEVEIVQIPVVDVLSLNSIIKYNSYD